MPTSSIDSLLPIAAVGAAGAVVGVLASRLLETPRPHCEIVDTPLASPAQGHYSQAIRNGGECFVSGLLPITAEGDKLNTATFAVQVKQVLSNLNAVLQAAGSSFDHLISVRVYITSVDDWPEFNRIYAETIGEHQPARAVVPVPELHYGFKLELEAIAAISH